jgi:hypothetical protein
MDWDQAHSEVVAVPDTFNPYFEWLGIKPGDSPPDHYTLLAIKRFEGDRQIVTSAAGAQLAKVRGIRPGSRLAEWQRVIDELTAAKNCLCDPAAKAAYDKALRQRSAPGGAAPGSAIKSTGQKPDRAKNLSASDSKVADQGRAGRNVLPPGRSDIAKQAGAPAASSDTPANSLNPLPPTKSRADASTKPASSGSGIAASANSALPQTPAMPAMRLPLPSAIPTTAMPAASSSSNSPQGASPLTPAGAPIHPLSMPGMALPQQSAVPGFRPAGSASNSVPTANPMVSGTPAILLTDSATPSPRQSANQSDQSTTSPLERLGIGDEPEFRRKTGPQRRSSRMPLVAAAIAIVAVVAVGLIIASKTRLGADLFAGGSSSTSSSAGDSNAKPSTVGTSTSVTATPTPAKAVDPPKQHSDSTTAQEKPKPAPTGPTDPSAQAKQAGESHTVPKADPRPKRPFNPLLDQAPIDIEPPKQAPPKVDPVKPTLDPVKPVPDVPADPAQAAKLNQLLVDVRSKLSQRRLADARKLIETASQLAATPDQHDAVDRIDALAKYVEGFWMAVRDAMKALKPTDEIDVTSTRKYIVVDASSDTLTLRTEGATRKYTIDSLPSGLAIILALRWFEADKPENSVYIGAFHLVDPKTGPEYAKKDWEAAAAAGVDVKNLLPLLEMKVKAALDSPVAPSAETGPLPVPPADALDKAERKLRAEMEAEFAAAAKPSEKIELAKKLIEQATSGNDPARRFVMQRAARDLAAEVGQPAVMIQAVDQMAAQFRIDPLDMKADALAAFPPKSVTTGRTWGEAALKLTDEASAAGRQALAGRYAQIAMAAARTANSLDLLRKAQKRAKEIQDAAKAEAGM